MFVTADKEFAVGGGRVGEVFFDVLLGDKADATLPAGWRVVEDVKDLELGFVNVEKLFEVVLEEDILFVDVGVYESDGGLVKGIAEGSTDDLDHGGDAGAACDHADVVGDAWRVLEVALGTLDANLVAEFELGKVTGDVAFLIGLEDA